MLQCKYPAATPLAAALIALLTMPAAIAAATAAPTAPATAADNPAIEATDLDKVEVIGNRYLPDYSVRATRTATKTDTPLLNVPQSITVITNELIRDQAMSGMQDVLRYVPGAGVAQGEGNRDTAVMRGNSTTADFFVDGIRDDVQYMRDLYNIERVEALKGPNAMIFGRGGSGGVINRVSKHADGETRRDLTLQLGTWNRRRVSGDLGAALGDNAAFRVNAMYEDSESFRDSYQLDRRGINPTLHFGMGERTAIDLGYEYFHDARVADRGVGSFAGRPIRTAPSLFIGNPEQSPVRATVHALDAAITHDFGNGVELRNHTRYADYDKSYQNVFGNGVSRAPDGSYLITLFAYSNDTQRSNVFNQTDLTFKARTGTVAHTFLAGAEFGRQSTDNLGKTGTFAGSAIVPIAHPRYAGTVVFAPTPTSADNHGVATVQALYAQDQIEFSPQWQGIVGVRYDRFDLDLRNNRTGSILSSRDDLLSPRAGLIFKPLDALSLYASYSMTYLPRSGEQLSSLSPSNRSLDPEQFINKELGLKWDLNRNLAFTAALYRLDRTNVAIPDPANPLQSILVDGQRSKGVELGIAGRITDAWQVMGGYAWQDGEISRTQSATAPAGNRLAQLPRNTFSLWNRFDFSTQFGAGIGVIRRDGFFTSTDNTVTVPGFTRVDAAFYYAVNSSLQLQLNVENVFDTRYFSAAHSNQNISPGAPRGAMLSVRARF